MACFKVTLRSKLDRMLEAALDELRQSGKVTVVGEGLSASKAVSLAEVVKSKWPGLSQTNKTYLQSQSSVLEIDLELVT